MTQKIRVLKVNQKCKNRDYPKNENIFEFILHSSIKFLVTKTVSVKFPVKSIRRHVDVRVYSRIDDFATRNCINQLAVLVCKLTVDIILTDCFVFGIL